MRHPFTRSQNPGPFRRGGRRSGHLGIQNRIRGCATRPFKTREGQATWRFKIALIIEDALPAPAKFKRAVRNPGAESAGG
jgi:hypothetical protein